MENSRKGCRYHDLALGGDNSLGSTRATPEHGYFRDERKETQEGGKTEEDHKSRGRPVVRKEFCEMVMFVPGCIWSVSEQKNIMQNVRSLGPAEANHEQQRQEEGDGKNYGPTDDRPWGQ